MIVLVWIHNNKKAYKDNVCIRWNIKLGSECVSHVVEIV